MEGSINGTTPTVILPAGGDGRQTVFGVRPFADLLYVAGGASGDVWVYNRTSHRLVAKLHEKHHGTLINDVAVTPNGTAYADDTTAPYFYKVKRAASGYQMVTWIDLRDTAVEYTGKPAIDGIAATPDGKYLILGDLTTGQLFRVNIAIRAVTVIQVAGGSLTAADGIDLAGHSLYEVRNVHSVIARVNLSSDYSSATLVSQTHSASFAYPTAVGITPTSLVVLNAQLDHSPLVGGDGKPNSPFTVVRIPRQ